MEVELKVKEEMYLSCLPTADQPFQLTPASVEASAKPRENIEATTSLRLNKHSSPAREFERGRGEVKRMGD